MSKYILPEGVEAKQENVSLWKGKNRYFHDKELAECELAIAQKCISCGESTESKYYIICDDCRIKQDRENYKKFPYKEWDGETPLVIYKTDIYFYSEDDIVFYCDDNFVDPDDLDLVLCEKVPIPEFKIDDLLEGAWDWEYDIPHEDKINEEVNAILREYLAKDWNVWEQGIYRTSVKV